MSYQKYNQGDSSWIADSVDDLQTLPMSNIGSTCYIIENASKYMVNSKGEWIRQTFPHKCSSDSSSENKPNDGDNETPGNTEEEMAEKYVSKEQYELEKLKNIKYEILGLPENSFVDYRGKEIRVFIPEDTKWDFQEVGPTGDPSSWYFQLRAYAPEKAENFKEDDLNVIEDETFYSFVNNSFAGIDKDGRKYSVVWLAAAKNTNNTWKYYGKDSTEDHMIGFYYSVEWYDKNKKLIGMDKIRINLTNKNCHAMIEPYYIGEMKTTLRWKDIENG